jgi:hypothetical protein
MVTSKHGFARLSAVVAVIGSVVACSDGASTARETRAGAAGGSSGYGGDINAGSAGFTNPSETGGGGSAALAADSTAPSAFRDGSLADMFIMVDKSVSMGCSVTNDTCDNWTVGTQLPPTRWSAVLDAINGFVNSPSSAGAGVGIGFFEGPDFCGVASYAKPTAPIAALPAAASAISSALATNSPGGTTPTEPALAGAIEYAKAYTSSTPGRTAVVVFVTDGMPNGCNSTVAGAAAIAEAGYLGTPSIHTYVIGLGATAALDQIAVAGSGGLDHYFPATGDVAAGLLKALETISNTPIR